MDTSPLWFRILEAHRGRNGSGLTASFLIGALRTLDDRQDALPATIDDLWDLLGSMGDDTPDGSKVRIYRCRGLNNLPTVSLAEHPGGLGHAVLARDGTPSQLHAWDDIFSGEDHTMESLLKSLWDVYGEALSAGKFSYEYGGFRPFKDEEITFIRDAVRSDDE